MVKVKENLINKVFDMLIVLKQTDDYIRTDGKHEAMWLCKCECGNKIIVRGADLKNGHTKSCGCFKKEQLLNGHIYAKKYNNYDLSGKYGIGYDSKNRLFYFDLEDYEKIKDYYWHINNRGYVVSTILNNGKFCEIIMHRVIVDCPDNMMVDHKHGRLTRNDNRKCNLRITDNLHNSYNSGLQSNNTSGVTGVYFDKTSNKWGAVITTNKKKINLGRFKKFEDAVKARKTAEEKYFGEYSYDNSQIN